MFVDAERVYGISLASVIVICIMSMQLLLSYLIILSSVLPQSYAILQSAFSSVYNATLFILDDTKLTTS
jgi:uncharacterized PurR-regulated membrane protein YhhQ (DUF165 family)